MRRIFHVLVHPPIGYATQFETFRTPIDSLEPEILLFGKEFDVHVYRMPGEYVAEDDFHWAGIVAASTIVNTTGLEFLGGQQTLH